VHSDCGYDLIVLLGQADGPIEFGRAIACADAEYLIDACVGGSFEDTFEVTCELFMIEVAVGVDEVHLLQARADRDIFEEAGEDWRASFE
jgi:hypothetical protein